jgi:putative ABC transport system permease protein
MKSQRGLGENIAIFWPGVTSMEFQGMPKGRRVRPTEEDCKLIQQKAKSVRSISPEFRRSGIMFKYEKQASLRRVIGIWPEFGDMRNLIPSVGSRFLNDRDMAERRRVVFIGNIMADDLFGDHDPIGKQVLVGGVPFTVIGVMKKKDQDSSYGGRDSRMAFIPATTFQAMYSYRYVNNFVVQNDPEYSMLQTRREVYEILGAKYRFDPTDDEALGLWDTTEGFAFLRNFFMAFSWFLIGIGITTLITGGIGVSNIMNVVLEERTKEIGIKMALGARKSMILMQFVFETLLITAVGGISGFIFAWVVTLVVAMAGLDEEIGVPRVDWVAGVLITVLLGIVGFTAGIFPARRAANLQPVQALKLF